MIQTWADALIIAFLVFAAAIWLVYLWRGLASRGAKIYWSLLIAAFFIGEIYFSPAHETISEITVWGQPFWLIGGFTLLAPFPFLLHWFDLWRRRIKAVVNNVFEPLGVGSVYIRSDDWKFSKVTCDWDVVKDWIACDTTNGIVFSHKIEFYKNGELKTDRLEVRRGRVRIH